MDEAEGLDKLEQLQHHNNEEARPHPAIPSTEIPVFATPASEMLASEIASTEIPVFATPAPLLRRVGAR